jgi:hypothetical protein
MCVRVCDTVTPASLITVEPVMGGEGTDFTFTFTMPLKADVDVSFDVATADGTTHGANAGADYAAVSTRLTIRTGETAVSVPVSVLEDVIDEATETFVVAASNIATAGRTVTLGDSVLGSITNDDCM